MMMKFGKYYYSCFVAAALLVVLARGAEEPPPQVEEDVLELTMFGDDKIKVPRRVVPDKPVGEIFYTYRECSKQGIRKHNVTHIFLPFDTMLTSEFSKIRHDDKNWEAGIAKQVFMEQGFQSIFRTAKNKPIAFSIEKTHALSMGGTKIETAPQPPTNRDPEDDRKAREKVVFRNRLIMKLAMMAQAAPMSFNSMVDIYHDALLDEFQEQEKEFHLPDLERAKKWVKDVEAKVASGGTPLKTNNECFHFTDHSGIDLVHDGMYYPLDKTNVAYKGEAEQQPQRHIGLNSGLSKFIFDDKKDTLEVHFLVSSRGYLSFSLEGLKESTSAFAISPIDGKASTKLAKPGGRQTSPEVGTMRYMAMQALRMLISNYPEDYKIMDEDHDKICSKEFEGKVAGFLKRFDTKKFFQQLNKAGLTNSIGILDDAVNAMQAWGQTGLCSTRYMKGATPGAYGFNFANVVGVLTHACMEMPYKIAFKTLNRPNWNILQIQSRDDQLKEEESESELVQLDGTCYQDLDCLSGECYNNLFGDDVCECNSGQYRIGHSGCQPDEECINNDWGKNYCLPKKRKIDGEQCSDKKECQGLKCDREDWWSDEGTCGSEEESERRRGLRA